MIYQRNINILANRACSLRLSNIFIATSIFVYYIVPNFTLVELLLMQCLGLLFTRLQDFISILIIEVLSFTITSIFTFGRASVSEIQ